MTVLEKDEFIKKDIELAFRCLFLGFNFIIAGDFEYVSYWFSAADKHALWALDLALE
jgi:hypothetical protein